MIKATSMGADGRQVIFLGLSHENLRRLKEEQPILVDTTELGWQKGPRIVLCAGETEDAITAQLQAGGIKLDHVGRKGYLWAGEDG